MRRVPPILRLAAGPALAAVVAVAAGGCGRSGELAPPDARWGEDVCAACNMIASEERHAAAAAVEGDDGRIEVRLYDDIGCLLADEEKGDARFLARWVHDLEDVRWVPADSAVFVISPHLQTPMGSGVGAFAAAARADAFAAKDGGDVVDWDGLRGRQRSEGLLAPPPAGS